MPSTQTDHLFKLIKSLSKSEKRNFKLYVNRIHSSDEVKFVQLFDVLDKQKKYDEESIFKKLPRIKRSQLSNLKRHLYKQLLSSLRLIHIQKNIDIQIREQIDYAKILYSKGLYIQSLKVLDKVKTIARDAHQDLLHLEIIEFEKLIEIRHITRSIGNRSELLTEEAEKRNKVITTTSQLSNLGLRLYGLYIKVGHIKSKKDSYIIQEFFKTNLPDLKLKSLTFFERVYFHQAYVWYYYILQNFPMCYKHALLWVDLFNSFPDMKDHDPDLYMRGLNNLLSALFHIGLDEKHELYLAELEVFCAKKEKSFNTNSELQAFLYIYTAQINKYFMQGRFTEGLSLMNPLDEKLKIYAIHLDQHRILMFYYKMACMYFSTDDNEMTIEYLNRIINLSVGNLREDIQCFARILHLIAHYELGHYSLLEYLVKSVYRFLAKMEDLNKVQSEILKFLRTALYMDAKNLRQAFIQLKIRLEKYVDHPYEKRSFLYLDIISWLECKIQNRPVQEVIREKFELKK